MSGIATPVLLVVIVGLIAAVLLVIASKVFYVKVDETVAEVREALPGANCGACGFAGCDDYAAAVAGDESVPCNKCSVGGANAAEAIAKILGRSAGSAEKEVALVRCRGNCDAAKQVLEWQGPHSCAAAKTFYNGSSACPTGCIGFGDCVNVCEFNSIQVFDGVAMVNRNTCVGCQMCMKECPQNLITMVPFKNQVHVLCQNQEKGGVTRKECSNGCIGCGKCAKVCPREAIYFNDDHTLATIDVTKCVSCGLCVGECPTGAINSFKPVKARAKKPAKKFTPEQIEEMKKAAAAKKAANAAKEA